MRRRYTTAVAASLIAVTALLTSCVSSPASDSDGAVSAPDATLRISADAMLAAYGWNDLSPRDLVDTLDALPLAERPTDLMVSVRGDELIVMDARQQQAQIPIDDMFYVSAAPFITQTHDCYYHSLTTCVGELRNTEVHVTVIDDASGEIVLDEQRTTFDNGFVGLWLPRDKEMTMTITSAGMSAVASIDTSDPDAATCLTTLQLTSGAVSD
ncbi:CueP family metal-binding protein [Microbacterium sp. YY-01]|uniref:CueP family metal-binding protein n=1 Tax=Microbacterium sp. YY-01 TaxID=3421634 RepID=UPI003D172083